MRLASAGPFLFPARCVGAVRRVARRAHAAVSAISGALALAACAPHPIHGGSAPARTAASAPLSIAPGVRVDRGSRTVIVDATVTLNQGFLEQLACTPSTRVHESLVAIDASPRELHAALLLAGLEPGAPGTWREVADATGQWTVDRVRPTGPRLDISVRWTAADGACRAMPILAWVRRIGPSDDPARAPEGEAMSPNGHLVFSGSRIRPNTASMGPGEHYVADLTGSVVGLVTFGDEVIAYDEVIADRAEVDAPAWVAWTDRIPPEGTRVELLIRAQGEGR